jgi:hypothetical protein
MNTTKKVWPALLMAIALLGAAACNTDDLLEVIDPDLVTPDNVQGEPGASLFWAGALGQFGEAFSNSGGGMAVYGGMMSDEFHLSGTFPTRNQVDRREIDERNGTMLGQYRNLHQARVGLENAADKLEEFVPGDSRIGEMYNLAGFTYLFFAEHYCSGVPFGSTPNEGDVVQGTPTTTEGTLALALERFSSAAGNAAGSTDQTYLSAVGSARAMVNQGNFGAAASAVAAVPTDWQYLLRSKGGGAGSQRNAIYDQNHSQRRWSLSDNEGGTGVAFRSRTDSRVPWQDAGEFGFDEETPLFHQLKFDSWDSDTPVASGIEARLIEAEADLNGGDPAGMMAKLNALRATVGLADLTDPGDEAGRVDMLFDERARWLFATAHRMGDLRRLVRQYGRNQADVFPSGEYFKGGVYGSDVTFPIPFEESENPNVEAGTNICIDRSA